MVTILAEYIDRDYVLKLLGVFNDRVHGDYHFMNGIETAKEIVEDAPSADVTPVVHGKWINTRPIVEYKGFCQVKCSICESIEPYGNYCPNCGARMDGEE